MIADEQNLEGEEGAKGATRSPMAADGRPSSPRQKPTAAALSFVFVPLRERACVPRICAFHRHAHPHTHIVTPPNAPQNARPITIKEKNGRFELIIFSGNAGDKKASSSRTMARTMLVLALVAALVGAYTPTVWGIGHQGATRRRFVQKGGARRVVGGEQSKSSNRLFCSAIPWRPRLRAAGARGRDRGGTADAWDGTCPAHQRQTRGDVRRTPTLSQLLPPPCFGPPRS